MPRPPFIRRVKIKNYKSIAACNLELGALNLIVGPNGSGKSNLLDALRFTSDALRNTLEGALRDRGGIDEVRRRGTGRPVHFGIRVEFCLPDGPDGHYSFEVAAKKHGAFEVQTEECEIHSMPRASFSVRSGIVTLNGSPEPLPVPPDRLYLVMASGRPEFRPLYDALSGMAFYNLNPDRMRALQPSDPGILLQRDGSNAASVVRVLAQARPADKRRLEEFLAIVVPGIQGVDAANVGPMETLQFRQEVASAKNPWRFYAGNMSDGTLRAFGILLALFQAGSGKAIPAVAIEEPEIALHPAAAGALLDALREASRRSQVIVTSHSPDLLDRVDTEKETVVAVRSVKGESQIAPLDEASRSALRDGLYTPGELLRIDQLEPDPDDYNRSLEQMALFGDSAE